MQNIVAEWILDKLEGAVCDLTDELSFLRASGMVDATLEDTTAVAMSPNGNAICPDGVKNKLYRVSSEIFNVYFRWPTYLSISGRKPIEALLDDMIAVQVLD